MKKKLSELYERYVDNYSDIERRKFFIPQTASLTGWLQMRKLCFKSYNQQKIKKVKSMSEEGRKT